MLLSSGKEQTAEKIIHSFYYNFCINMSIPIFLNLFRHSRVYKGKIPTMHAKTKFESLVCLQPAYGAELSADKS